MLDLWYSYAGPLVYLCWTFGTRMLYSSGTVFFLIYSQYFKFDLSPIHLPIIYIFRI